MPRDIPVSNGNLLVSFDLDYRIRDLYFPWIGQENHRGEEGCRFGVWVDGEFSWVGPEWEKDIRYADDSLVTDVKLIHPRLALALRCHDAVDFQLDVYLKQVDVLDLAQRARDVRLFFSQDFHLYGDPIGDTAYVDPRSGGVVHYKRSRYILVNCHAADASGTDYASCGVKKQPGRPPSWKDVENGELAGSPISWGFAESTVGVRLSIPPGGSRRAFHWMAVGTRYDEVADLNRRVIAQTPSGLLARTGNYWKAWSRKETRDFGDLPVQVREIFNRSLLVLRTQIDNRGAITAANDSDIVRFGGDTYSYMWGRDGAFVAVALAKAGYPELCRSFFDFCGRALTEDGYLFQHYNPDGSLASNWHAWILEGKQVLPIQEDSTALLLWSLWVYYGCSRDIGVMRTLYEDVIVRCADFLLAYRDPETLLPTPSYDLWEERYGVHAYTVATVIAGLRAAANFARVLQESTRAQRYDAGADQMVAGIAKHLYDHEAQRYARSGYRTPTGYDLDPVVDISLLGLVTFGALSPTDPRVVSTVETIRRQLVSHTSIGGVARYSDDRYQRAADVPEDVAGNPWFISTLWLAEYEMMRAETLEQLRAAVPHLEWCANNALPSGVLAEQVHPVTGHPLSVSPLTWSHSAFVWAVMSYVERFHALGGLGLPRDEIAGASPPGGPPPHLP